MQPEHDIEHLLYLLREPDAVSADDAPMLRTLTGRYPYFAPLHLLLAKAGKDLPDASLLLAKASLYNGGALTHHILTSPSTRGTLLRIPALEEEEEVVATPDRMNSGTEEEVQEIQEITAVQAFAEERVEKPEESGEQESSEQSFREANKGQPESDEQETYEEIVEVNSGAYTPVWQPEEYNLEAEAQCSVSKYDDDKLPYTFLWWLAKTRKEHAQIFQPYVSEKKHTVLRDGELQQQYVEHIFHLQTPFDLEEASKSSGSPLPGRQHNLIDNFIKNEPQIKAPNAEQLNTENKAKKSAEDHYDLVSETLAAIYIEQMLYHKAIDTYQKLSLKFPEKSRYFADLIQSLEKKI